MCQILSFLFDLFKSTSSKKSARTLDPKQREEDKLREPSYRQILEEAEAKLDARIRANECPRARVQDFEVLGYLCKGYFASVYKVRQPETDRNFALKVQPKSMINTPAIIAKAIFEKQLTYAIQNAFVIELHYAFQDAAYLYLVLEHAPYGDLRNVIQDYPEPEIIALYMAQLVLGLEYLHSCNILHRDLKPQNIFICEDLYLKIGDFGIAKKVTERTFTNVGTTKYMAPEQFGSDGFGKAVDWWALGIILYKLAYNEHPFCRDGDDNKKMAECIKHDELTFPYNIELDDPVNDLIEGLLQKDSHKRLGGMVGGAFDVKAHVWFSTLSFFQVLDKKIPIDIDLRRKNLRVNDNYEFIQACNDAPFDPEMFQGF